MTDTGVPALIQSADVDGIRAVYEVGIFGYRRYHTSSLPDRLYSGMDDARRPPSLHAEAAVGVKKLPTPAELLTRDDIPRDAAWPTLSRRTIGRLESLWLLVEDRQHLLDAQSIDPLPHQTALVEHVVGSQELQRVLIADEVGLGKTIEAGLIIQRLQSAQAGLRVLYLTEARLVPNVVEEFDRIGVNPRPRLWTAEHPEARLKPGDSDPMVVASIHKAVANPEQFAQAGPWDVLVVDEAHHLTDYSDDGGDPQERMKLVRKLLKERLTPGGRVLLLSGTPHQGHLDRFKNLLKLLSPRDDLKDANGKVIYRIKDDIVGWDNTPLFPLRDVRPHRTVQVSDAYHRWMADVHSLLAPGPGAARAAAWRRAQALQWCASSPEAGLAYLARLALRSGYRTQNPAIRRALEVLRPYRDGLSTEHLDALAERMLKGSRELGEEPDDVFGGGETLLLQVLKRGSDLVAGDAFGQKLAHLNDLFAEAPDEKFVIFAQPIETVHTLRRRLEERFGSGTVSCIVGGQKDVERRREIERFVGSEATRFMVSSRSGGEGINLQVSRRLVHFDVPWNPMEMEQRVGRVHRYGGARTVIVDTLVLDGSRETRVLSRARARLASIVKDLDRTRFELLYSRTMALIPLEELAVLLAGEQFAPLDQHEETQIDQLVQRGLELLREAEGEFRSRAAQLAAVTRGEVDYADLYSWLQRFANAKELPGCQRIALTEGSDGRVHTSAPTRVLRLPDKRKIHVSPEPGIGVEDESGHLIQVQRVGLNDAYIATKIYETVAEEDATLGAASVLIGRESWDAWRAAHAVTETFKSGALVLAYLTRRIDQAATPPERSVAISGFLLGPDGNETHTLAPAAVAALVRLIREPRPKQRPTPLRDPIQLRLRDAECLDALRQSSPGEPMNAVFPIAAIQLEVD